MDFSEYLSDLFSFARSHPVVTVVVALGLLLFIYRKPKIFFTLLFLGLIIAGVVYIIVSMAGSGSEQKKKLIDEEEKQVDSIYSPPWRSSSHFSARDLCTHEKRSSG